MREASGSVVLFEDEDKIKLQDTIIRRSLEECEPNGSGCFDYKDSHSCRGLVSEERKDLQITTNLPRNPIFAFRLIFLLGTVMGILGFFFWIKLIKDLAFAYSLHCISYSNGDGFLNFLVSYTRR